jgi:hypothetical protein
MYVNITAKLFQINSAFLLLDVSSLYIEKKKIYFHTFIFNFYVTDGNIMYLTYASRFLISCVIQHYAPVVGWEQMHNVDYDPGP